MISRPGRRPPGGPGPRSGPGPAGCAAACGLRDRPGDADHGSPRRPGRRAQRKPQGRLGDDPALSRLHPVIVHSGRGELRVSDVGSANGTFLNGSRVDDSALIRVGDIIELGSTRLKAIGPFTGAPPAAAGTTLAAPGRAPGPRSGLLGLTGLARGQRLPGVSPLDELIPARVRAGRAGIPARPAWRAAGNLAVRPADRPSSSLIERRSTWSGHCSRGIRGRSARTVW
jgi:FHA domain